MSTVGIICLYCAGALRWEAGLLHCPKCRTAGTELEWRNAQPKPSWACSRCGFGSCQCFAGED